MRVEFGFFSNDPDGRCELRLVDDNTGMNFASLKLDARQFRDLIAGGGVKVDVNVLSQRYVPLLGADMQVEIVKIARAVYGDEYTRGGVEPKSVTKFAQELEVVRQGQAADGQVVHVETRNTNAGWQALVRTYTLRNEEDA